MEMPGGRFHHKLLARLLHRDPLEAASQIVEKAIRKRAWGHSHIDEAVLDVCHGNRRYTKAYGNSPGPERVFAVASIAKPMIATVVLLLRDRGQLSLQDRVTKFVPGMNEKDHEAISIQHLLTHTAGLPDNLPDIHEMLHRKVTLDEIFERARKLPLLFFPGTHVSYSNLGVLFAQRIVEAITNMPMRQ